MRDTLKEFIKNNRESFDDLSPRDLWSDIDSSLGQTSSSVGSQSAFRKAFLKKLPTMLKFGFGASALIVGTFVAVSSQKNDQGATKVVGKNEPAVYSSKVASQQQMEPVLPVTVVPELKPIEAASREDQGLIAQMPSFAAQSEQDTVGESPDPVSKAVPSYFISKAPKDSPSPSAAYTNLDTIFKGINKIEVNVEFCNVSVCAIAGENVRLHGKVSESAGSYIILGRRAYKRSQYKLKFDLRDSILTVWMECEKTNKKMLSKDMESQSSVLNFEVPASINVDINSTSGHISANGLSNENTRLSTSFGDIKANNISSHLVLRSSSGNITLTKIAGDINSEDSYGHQRLSEITGNVSLRTSSGNTILKNIKGNVDMKSSYGNYNCENIQGNVIASVSSGHLWMKFLSGNIDAKSSYGDLHFDDVAGNVTAKASSGNIKINNLKGMLLLGTSYGNITGKNVTLIDRGDFKTSTGDIQMNLLNEINDLSFDLQASTGNLLVEKANVRNSSSQKLLFGQGAILVKGISNYGNQSYR